MSTFISIKGYRSDRHTYRQSDRTTEGLIYLDYKLVGNYY